MSQTNPLTLQLRAANPIEPELGWDSPEFCSGPLALLKYLVENVSINAEQLDNITELITFSGTEPDFSEAKKIWVKTSAPVGLGYYANGKWNINYQFSPHGLHIIPEGAQVPSAMTILSDSDAEERGLAKGYRWGVFTP